MSTPELDDVLLTIRNKLILPSYLSETDRRRLRRPSAAKTFAADPVTMEVNGERIIFEPYDPTKVVAIKPRDILFEAVDKFITKEDWAQLPRLLEGIMQASKKPLRPADYTKLIRMAGMHRSTSVILKCARGAEYTGFKIDTLEKADSIMYWLLRSAASRPRELKRVQNVLEKVEEVLELAELEKHQYRRPRPDSSSPRFPLHADPQLLATPLLLSCVLAFHEASAEAFRKAYTYARAISRVWPENTSMLLLHGPASKADELMVGYLQHPVGFMRAFTPVAIGIHAASELFASKRPDHGLASMLARIEKDIWKDGAARMASAGPESTEYYNNVNMLLAAAKEPQQMKNSVESRLSGPVVDGMEAGVEAAEGPAEAASA
jgi:hypothetical protein